VILAHAITGESNKIKYDLVTAPFKQRQQNRYNSYGFYFGGCGWFYIVDQRKTTDFYDFQLRSSGTMQLPAINWKKFLNW
jgi:hypothetical protein